MAPGAATTAKRVAVALDRLRPPPDGLTILIYHRVGAGSGASVDLPPALFEEQVAFLAEQCRIYSLSEAADLLGADLASRPAGLDHGRPCVTLTFDDGTADFVDHALPVLARHGVPATYFLATDFVDRRLPFPDGARPMSWAQASEMVASGLVEVGSHTHTHALLDRVSRADAACELDRSIGAIEDHLGVRPQHFAYPKAVLGSPEAQAEVRRRFRTAAIARTRPNPWRGTDLHRLNRSPVQVVDGMEFFEHKVRGGMHLENDLRDVVNRWRYRGARR